MAATAFLSSFHAIRVIAENGNLTGYTGGLWREKWLLDFEREMIEKGKQ